VNRGLGEEEKKKRKNKALSTISSQLREGEIILYKVKRVKRTLSMWLLFYGGDDNGEEMGTF
jgi:hypothetical protein